MPFETTYGEDGVFLGTGAGVVTAEQWVEAARKLYADPRFVEPTRVLWDLREADLVWPASHIDAELEFVRSERSQRRGRAAAVVRSELAYGLARMFELRAQDLALEIRVFREWEPAVAWIREDF